MRRHRNGKCKGFVIGAFFGSLLGGISALLFAPKSGKKLRKDISRKYHDVSDKAHDVATDVCDKCTEFRERAMDIAEDAKDATRSMIKKARKRK